MAKENDNTGETVVETEGQTQTPAIPADADVSHTKAFQGLLADKQSS